MYACAVYNKGLRFPDRLPDYVSRFGPLADVKISRNGRGINYALVTFANPFARRAGAECRPSLASGNFAK